MLLDWERLSGDPWFVDSLHSASLSQTVIPAYLPSDSLPGADSMWSAPAGGFLWNAKQIWPNHAPFPDLPPWFFPQYDNPVSILCKLGLLTHFPLTCLLLFVLTTVSSLELSPPFCPQPSPELVLSMQLTIHTEYFIQSKMIGGFVLHPVFLLLKIRKVIWNCTIIIGTANPGLSV